MGEPAHADDANMGRHLRSIRALGAGYWWHDHRHEIVRQALPPGCRRLLDYGCGSGAFLTWLAERTEAATELCGYDVSGVTKALLDAGGDRITLLPDWPPRAAGPGFDAVVAMDVLEHVEDDVGCLRSLAGALAPGGRLVVTVPAHQLFWSSWDVRLGHFRRYDGARLRSAMAEAGLVVDRLTHLFSFLTAPALVRRLLPAKPSAAPAEFAPLPGALNAALRAVCAVERRLLGAVDLPLGTSLLAVAHRGDGRRAGG